MKKFIKRNIWCTSSALKRMAYFPNPNECSRPSTVCCSSAYVEAGNR